LGREKAFGEYVLKFPIQFMDAKYKAMHKNGRSTSVINFMPCGPPFQVYISKKILKILLKIQETSGNLILKRSEDRVLCLVLLASEFD
jgi:hypothetical protein